jgi:hypothetical protein
MIAHLRRTIISIVVFTIFFGFVYAFVGTGVAQLFFSHQADGSITANGSTLIGQNWSTRSARDIHWAAACSRAVPTTSALRRPAHSEATGVGRGQPPRGLQLFGQVLRFRRVRLDQPRPPF